MAKGAAGFCYVCTWLLQKQQQQAHSPQQHYDNHRVIPARPAQSVARLQLHIYTWPYQRYVKPYKYVHMC